MDTWTIANRDGFCSPHVGAGVVTSSSEPSSSGVTTRTVRVLLNEGYSFVKWVVNGPDFGSIHIDAAVWASIQGQLRSPTMIWTDPSGFYGIQYTPFVAIVAEVTGLLLYGKTGFPIFGSNGKLLYEG